MAPSIGVISYCDRIRTLATANHELYARDHDYTYIFDIAPTANKRFLAKVEKVGKFLPLFDWVFWLDDDAFIMKRDVRLETFIDQSPEATLIVCESPINEGKWTWLSSGNFLLRNTPDAAQLLADVIATDLDVVEAWWDPVVYGYFTRGDQDAFVYQLNTNPRYGDGFVARLPFDAFNARPFHFTDEPDEHFLVHFTGGEKGRQARLFGDRFGLTEALVPAEELRGLMGVYSPPPPPPAVPAGSPAPTPASSPPAPVGPASAAPESGTSRRLRDRVFGRR